MKAIIFKTPEGKFAIPLRLVAEDRANYYVCEVEGQSKDSTDWKDEVEWVMDDDFEGIDWLINNNDWDEWKSKSIRLDEKSKTKDEDFWNSSDNFDIATINTINW